jgi:hypothetical protein
MSKPLHSVVEQQIDWLSEFVDRRLDETYFVGHDFEGKVVADPFMGGGTPLIEANRIGRARQRTDRMNNGQSGSGPFRQIAALHHFGRKRGAADKQRPSARYSSVAIDPTATIHAISPPSNDALRKPTERHCALFVTMLLASIIASF